MDTIPGFSPEAKRLAERSQEAIREGRRLIAALHDQRAEARKQIGRLHGVEAEFRRPTRILYPSDTRDPRLPE